MPKIRVSNQKYKTKAAIQRLKASELHQRNDNANRGLTEKNGKGFWHIKKMLPHL